MQEKKKQNTYTSDQKNGKPSDFLKNRQSSQVSSSKNAITDLYTEKSKINNDQFSNFYKYLNQQKEIGSDVSNKLRNLSEENIQPQNPQISSFINAKKKYITMGLQNSVFDENFVNELVQKNENFQKQVSPFAEDNLKNQENNGKWKSQMQIGEFCGDEKAELKQQIDQQICNNYQLNTNDGQKSRSKQKAGTNSIKAKQIQQKMDQKIQQTDQKKQQLQEIQKTNESAPSEKQKTQKSQLDVSKINFCSPRDFIHKRKQQQINDKLEKDFQDLNQMLKTPEKDIQNDQHENDDQELLLEQDSDKSAELNKSDSQNSSEKKDQDEESNEDDHDDQNYDDENKIDQLQKLKEEEENSLREFAKKNGFTFNDPSAKKKELDDIYTEAANFKITKEFLDEQEKLDRERFFKQMYRPPALEILEKKYVNKEPVRTGFNQGLIPLFIKNNYESNRMNQGPNIVVKTTTASQKRNDQNSRERGSRMSQRQSHSRESQVSRFENFHKSDLNLRNSSIGNNQVSSEGQDGEENEQQKIQLVQTQNNETSLRHLFYLEYKKIFPENQSNPIVYSRFGKASYNSDEKFDNANFNQLIRTCNLKKILKNIGQLDENKDKTERAKVKRKFQEPLSYPCNDYYSPKDNNDKTLVFESRFESGNLQLASKVSENEYDLILQNDINSKGHTQWFFYRVNNVRRGMKVKFNMLNMIKSKSLYNEGMKVLIYSQKRQEHAEFLQQNSKNTSPINFQENSGWVRGGEDLGYYQNNYKKENQTNSQRCYFTFTFTHTFEFDNDYVYFAYSLPYTYTDLTDYLCEIQQKQLNYVTRKTLCRTIAGNKCEYLSITNRVPYEVDKLKEGVVLTARIHPGETISSWIMKGIIDFLISSDPKANELRNKFVFKIVPMLNPDGVINGNYRCSLAGCDLNRRWKYPSDILHPTVYHTKNLIIKLANERPLALYCDIHAHSRRKNMFIYGNQNLENPEQPRAFPFLLSKVGQPHFSYDYSKFNYSRSKEQTARIAVWRELGSKIPNIFTLEASFCGPKPVKFEPHRGNKRAPSLNDLNYHFITKDFLDTGKHICEALILYRTEKDSSEMGMQNLEYQVEQYQIEKQQKMQQEELIRQQQQLMEQRKLLEIQNRQTKNTTTIDQQKADSALNNHKDKLIESSFKKDLNQSAIKLDKVKSIQQSVKKNLKKTKTDNLTDDLLKSTDDLKIEIQAKSKVNYNIEDRSDESDALSDSEPSEDNFEEEQILKLIPKKYGKKKFITGNDEVVPKPKKKEKKEKKQIKTELMPCLQSKRKDLEEKQKKEQQSAEKPIIKKHLTNSISKTIIKRRNGIMCRDVATQIMYISDGSNLSLMEIDILNNTGCKWSPIIFPGFQGQFKVKEVDNIGAYERDQNNRNLNISASILLNQDIQGVTTTEKKIKSMDLSEKKISLRNENQQIKHSSINGNKQEQDSTPNILNLMQVGVFGYQKSLSNFADNLLLNSDQGKFQNTLQQKIQDTKFQEPKSLMYGAMNSNFTGSSKKQQFLRQNPFEYGNGKSHESIKQKGTNYNNIMQNLNLETVHEKVNDKFDQNDEAQINTLEVNDKQKLGQNQFINLKPQSNINQMAQLKIKKIINGNIVQKNVTNQQINIMQSVLSFSNQKQNGFFQKASINEDTHNSAIKPQQPVNYSSSKAQQLSLSVNSSSKNQQTLESKSSFSKVAHQILLNNSDNNKKHKMNFTQQAYDDQIAQGTASNFSYNQSAKIRQDNILMGQFDFLSCSYQTKQQKNELVEKTLNKIALNMGQRGQQGISSISQLTGGISIQNQDINNI